MNKLTAIALFAAVTLGLSTGCAVGTETGEAVGEASDSTDWRLSPGEMEVDEGVAPPERVARNEIDLSDEIAAHGLDAKRELDPRKEIGDRGPVAVQEMVLLAYIEDGERVYEAVERCELTGEDLEYGWLEANPIDLADLLKDGGLQVDESTTMAEAVTEQGYVAKEAPLEGDFEHRNLIAAPHEYEYEYQIPHPDTLVAAEHTCGNGRREAGERCDDGNDLGGDGCSRFCVVERGYLCLSFADQTSRCFPMTFERSFALERTY